MKDVRWLSPAEQEAWRLFLRFYRTFSDRLDSDLAPYGFDQPDYEILALLSEAPDRQLRMSELANVVVSPRSRLTYQINQLVNRGLVERRKCDTDGRGAFACLTGEGLNEVQRLAPIHVGGVRRYLFDLLGPGDLEQFRALLLATVRNLEQSSAESLPTEIAAHAG